MSLLQLTSLFSALSSLTCVGENKVHLFNYAVIVPHFLFLVQLATLFTKSKLSPVWVLSPNLVNYIMKCSKPDKLKIHLRPWKTVLATSITVVFNSLQRI